MYVILAFDVEDVYYPPEYRIDDIPGWLAEIMSEVGLRGTFCVFGEKAEILMARGRHDVLKKMAEHDIASHQHGNRYPLVPQVVEGKGWREGVEAARRYEDWVKEQIRAAFGKDPAAFSRHNVYFAPQHVAVAGERGISYLYMISQLPGSHQPLWYAGTLTFPEMAGSELCENYYGIADSVYSRDEVFEKQLKDIDKFITGCLARGDEWITLYACHPVKVMARGWLEAHALTTGKSRSPGEIGWHYDVKPREEEERAKANFKRLCLYLKEHRDLNVVGIEEATRLFSTQPAHIDRDAMVLYAAEMVASEKVVFHSTFSPAEMVCGLADSLIHYAGAGNLPEKVTRRNVLGPVSRPVIAQEKDIVTQEEVVSICRQVVGEVESSGHLSANAIAGDARVGVGQIAFLAAKSYLALARHDKYEKLAVPSIPRYPEIALEISTLIRKWIGESWAMPLDFSCEAMAEHARLQTWTMKPAWLRPPQGPVPRESYASRCYLKI